MTNTTWTPEAGPKISAAWHDIRSSLDLNGRVDERTLIAVATATGIVEKTASNLLRDLCNHGYLRRTKGVYRLAEPHGSDRPKDDPKNTTEARNVPALVDAREADRRRLAYCRAIDTDRAASLTGTADATMAVADAELLVLVGRVAELEAEVAQRDRTLKWEALAVANFKAEAANARARAERAEAALAAIRLAVTGAVEKRFMHRRWDESIQWVVPLDLLNAALASAARAVSDGEGATSEAADRVREFVIARDGFYGREAADEDLLDVAPVDDDGTSRSTLLWSDLRAIVNAPAPETYDDRREEFYARPASPVVAPSATDEGCACKVCGKRVKFRAHGLPYKHQPPEDYEGVIAGDGRTCVASVRFHSLNPYDEHLPSDDGTGEVTPS